MYHQSLAIHRLIWALLKDVNISFFINQTNIFSGQNRVKTEREIETKPAHTRTEMATESFLHFHIPKEAKKK
jgi:hypothetical protein